MIPYPPERKGHLIVGVDPGEHSGFCVVSCFPEEGFARMPRCPVLFQSPSFEELCRYMTGRWRDVSMVLFESQYQGKASAASRTTLSQRTGFLAGLVAAQGVPLDRICFVVPQNWYKGIGCSNLTKDVCLARVEKCLAPEEKLALDFACGPSKPKAAWRMDVLAAIGIAWSYPFLSELQLQKGKKLIAMSEEPKPPKKAWKKSKRGTPFKKKVKK